MLKLRAIALASLLIVTVAVGCTASPSSTDQSGIIETAIAQGLETALAGNVEPTATTASMATSAPEATAVATPTPEPTATPLPPTAIPTPVPTSTPVPKYLEYNPSWFYEPPVTEEEAGRLWDSWLGSNLNFSNDNSERLADLQFLVRKKEGKYEIVDSFTNLRTSGHLDDVIEQVKSGDDRLHSYMCNWNRDFSPDSKVDWVFVESKEQWDSSIIVRAESEPCGDYVALIFTNPQINSILDSIDIYYRMTDKNQDKINNVPAADFDITIFGMDDDILFEQSYKLTPDQASYWTSRNSGLKNAGYVISIDRSKISNPTSNSTGKLKAKIVTYDRMFFDMALKGISGLPTNTNQ